MAWSFRIWEHRGKPGFNPSLSPAGKENQAVFDAWRHREAIQVLGCKLSEASDQEEACKLLAKHLQAMEPALAADLLQAKTAREQCSKAGGKPGKP